MDSQSKLSLLCKHIERDISVEPYVRKYQYE